MFQAFGLNGASLPLRRVTFAVRCSIRNPQSAIERFRLKPAVEADGSGGRKCLSPKIAVSPEFIS